MADEPQNAVSKTWSDERFYFTAFWIGVATCAIVQSLFVLLMFLIDPDRTVRDEKFFVLKCFRNACTAMPVAGVVAAMMAVLMRWNWKLSWILVLPAADSFLLAMYVSLHNTPRELVGVFLVIGLVLFVAACLLFYFLRKMCDSAHDAGFFYIFSTLVVCESLLILYLPGEFIELRRMLNVAAIFSLSVFDGILLLLIRKLQKSGGISHSPARFNFSLRALMIVVITAGAWLSLIVTLHQKPHEKVRTNISVPSSSKF